MPFSYVPGRSVEVPKIDFAPTVEVPAVKSALLVIDMQNDFVSEGGSLICPAAQETVPRIRRLVDSARKAEVRIAYTRDTQTDDDPEFRIWPKHCVEGTWGWEIIGDLKPRNGDLICPKNRYDGFYGTWLDHFLRSVWHVDHLIIVGTVSNICVLHTAASAGLRWYGLTVPADGISALTEFDQALTLRQVSSLYDGKVVKSVEDVHFV
jgi:nicotinamidase-related amidase